MKAALVKKQLDTFIPMLSSRQQEIILDMIKNILRVDKKEKRISVEQYNSEVEEAFSSVKKGKYINHNEVLKNAKKWLKKR